MLAPPPPDASAAGPARETLSTVADAIAREERAALDVATAAIRLTGYDGLEYLVLVAHGERFAIEESGLRALLMYYTAAFPRLTPAALLMRPATLARVVGEGLTDHAGELPTDVRLRVRRAPGQAPAIYAATPTIAPPYDVDLVLSDLEHAAPPACGASVTYAAGDSRAMVFLGLGPSVALPHAAWLPVGAWLRVDVTDGYPCRVVVTCGVGETDLGDPAPERETRRRASRDVTCPPPGLYTPLFAAKLAAVPAWIRAKYPDR